MPFTALNLGIVGATGVVGRELLAVLEERALPLARLEVFASPLNQGTDLLFQGHSLQTQVIEPGCFKGLDVVLGATSAELAAQWVPQAVAEGALVIDSSTAFRRDEDVPLVVLEVNAAPLSRPLPRGVVASPGGVAIQLTVALAPLKQAGLKRVVVSTYEATSGVGRLGMESLNREILRLYRTGDVQASPEEEPQDEFSSPFPHQIAFNALPLLGHPLTDGSSSEERQLLQDCQRLLELPDLRGAVTRVRVPWYACHAAAVHVEFERPLPVAEARRLLEEAPGIVVEDAPLDQEYPMPFAHAGHDEVYVGRLRADPSVPHGLSLWVVADNLRKGGAVNAIQLLEALAERLPKG